MYLSCTDYPLKAKLVEGRYPREIELHTVGGGQISQINRAPYSWWRVDILVKQSSMLSLWQTAEKKNLFIMTEPLRPYLTPPQAQLLSEFVFIKKKFFFPLWSVRHIHYKVQGGTLFKLLHNLHHPKLVTVFSNALTIIWLNRKVKNKYLNDNSPLEPPNP